jgi:ornithine carbamoyltransferase
MHATLKDLIRTADLSADDLHQLFELAAQFKTNPEAHGKPLDGETVVLYFAKPSTRTRVSFDAAVAHFGGIPDTVGPDELQLGRGETIEDTARVISGYAKAFVIRTFSDDDIRRFAAAATIPVINALSNGHHPCQSVADQFTLRELFGELRGLRLAFLGDGNNNVTHSLMEGAALLGLDMVVASPPGYQPDPQVTAWAAETARRAGGRVTVTDDSAEAVDNAHALYADVWLSMGDAPEEHAARWAALQPYRVTSDTLRCAAPGAVFMHCLPAHRGDEVTADVIDGTQSVVFQQAQNRLPTEMAVLYALLEGRLTGAAALADQRG